MKLKSKLFIYLLIMAIVPSILIAGLSVIRIQQSTVEYRVDQLVSISTIHENRVEQMYDDELDKIQLITSRTSLRENLDTYLQTGNQSNLDKINKIIEDAMLPNSFLDISIAATNGTILASTNSTMVFKSIANTSFYEDGYTSYNIKNVGIENGNPYLHMLGPLEIDDEIIGICYIRNWIPHLKELNQDYQGLGETGETLIGVRLNETTGLFLTHLRFDQDAAVGREFSFNETQLPINHAINKEEDIFHDTVDYRGEKVISVTQYIDGFEWGLVSKMDSNEINQPIFEWANAVLLVIFTVFFVSGIMAQFSSKRLSRPIKKLNRTANEIAEGNTERKIEVYDTEEYVELSNSLNKMLDTLIERDELMRIQKELKRINAELENFAYIASHDLQEPLRVIHGFSSILKEEFDEDLTEDQQYMIDSITKAVDRMQKLIDDLLRFSRVGRKGETEIIDLNEVLDGVKIFLSKQISENNAKIIADDLPTVEAIPSQMHQVFQNLVGNGIKFRAEEDPVIRITVDEGPEFYTFTVEDNGIGIEPKYFDKVFLIFQRLHTRSEYKGTGIGLALSKKIIEFNGGKIWIEEEEQGTKIKFTLPKIQDEEDSE